MSIEEERREREEEERKSVLTMVSTYAWTKIYYAYTPTKPIKQPSQVKIFHYKTKMHSVE